MCVCVRGEICMDDNDQRSTITWAANDFVEDISVCWMREVDRCRRTIYQSPPSPPLAPTYNEDGRVCSNKTIEMWSMIRTKLPLTCCARVILFKRARNWMYWAVCMCVCVSSVMESSLKLPCSIKLSNRRWSPRQVLCSNIPTARYIQITRSRMCVCACVSTAIRWKKMFDITLRTAMWVCKWAYAKQRRTVNFT